MVHRTIVLRSLIALATLVASIVLLFGAVSHVHPAQAQGLATTTKEYTVPSGVDPWGTAMDSSGHLWVALPGCDPAPVCNGTPPPGQFDVFNPSTSSWIGTHQLPTGYTQPLFLAFDKQGMLWFPLPMGNSIGMYNPTNNTFKQWAVPTSNAGPWDLAIDSKGNIWFTEHFSNKIGRFNPTTHSFIEVPTPATNSQPYGITVDAVDNVWFTENNSSVAMIAKYNRQGSLLEYKIRKTIDTNLTPHLIKVDGTGNVWWTEGFVGEIGKLQPKLSQPGTHKGVTEYAYPEGCSTCGAHTSGIGVDSGGLVWFDDSLQSIFGSFDPKTTTFSTYTTLTPNSHPHDGLMVDSQNRVWFDEEFANKIARVM